MIDGCGNCFITNHWDLLLDEYGYGWKNAGAKAYYEAMQAQGLTAGVVQTVYGVGENILKEAIDTLFVSSGVNLPSVLYLFLGNNENIANIEANTATAMGTFANSPTFGPDGFVTNGINQYFIVTGLMPSTFYPNTSQGQIMTHTPTWVYATNKSLVAATVGSTQQSAIFVSGAGLTSRHFTSTSGPATVPTIANSYHEFGANGANQLFSYGGLSGALNTVTGTTGGVRPNINYYAMARNLNNVADQLTNGTMGMLGFNSTWNNNNSVFREAYRVFCTKIGRSAI